MTGIVGGLMLTVSCLTVMAADDPVLTTAFGTGVHAYYAGDYQRSYDDLSAAIDGGSSDPRAFYFRGLAALKLGRLDEADADFATGAMREAAALGTWNVPRSLERIQGEDRLRLEKHRARARVALMQRRREAIVRRYTEVDAAQESVLRRRRPEAVPAREASPGEEPAAADEPREELPEPDAAEPADEPATSDDEPAADDDADSPFGDDEPAAKSSADEPAAEEPADESAVEEPADEPAEDADSDAEDPLASEDEPAAEEDEPAEDEEESDDEPLAE